MQTIGRYRVVRQLGRGGMGEVYLAEDPALHRQVALKVLTGSDETARRRFVREAITASQLDHPNVAVVHEAGETDDGLAFIAMQYIEGESLAERLLKGRLAADEAAQRAIEIADALAEAHEHGIIHRDIKPSNIMIDTRGHAKVLDFGIAKTFGDRLVSPEATTAEAAVGATTASGVFVGTLQYVSPEQAQGKLLDARSDLFSLGIVLYEMATGENPFVAATTDQTIRKILYEAPPPIPRSMCPRPLQRIIFKCLQKDAALRYGSARELQRDLEAFLQRAKARNRYGGAVAAIVAAAIGAVVFLQWPRQAVALTQQDTILLGDFSNGTRDPVFDHALRDALAIQLGQSPYLNLFPDSRVRETLAYMRRPPDTHLTAAVAREICQRNGLKAFLTGAVEPLGSQYVVTLEAIAGQSGDTLARAQVEAPSKEAVLHAVGSAALEFRRKVGESLQSIKRFDTPIEEATTSSLEALRAFSAGDEKNFAARWPEAISYYRRAVEVDPQFALAYARLAAMYHNMLSRQEGAEALTKAFELRGRTTERERNYIETLYYDDVTGDLDKMLESARLWADTYPRDNRAHLYVAAASSDLGNDEEALREMRRAMALDPRVVALYATSAEMLIALNRPSDARAMLQQGLARAPDLQNLHLDSFTLDVAENDTPAIARELAWSEKKNGYYIQYGYGQLLFARGQPPQADRAFRHAMEMAGRGGVVELQRATDLLGNALLGRCSAVQSPQRSAVSERDWIVGMRAGTALALCGRAAEAETLAAALGRNRPKDTLVNGVAAPVIRAAIALHGHRAADAVDGLRRVVHTDNAERLPELIGGLAHLAQRDGRSALSDFNTILDHPYRCRILPQYPLAQLGAARAAALAGDRALARQRYQEFFASWKDAERDLPALVEAKKEFAALH